MFLIYCESKECRQEMAPVIDKKTKVVHCSECDAVVNNIDPFMKGQLANLGQIRRDNDKKMAFGVQCTYCERKGTPKLGPKKEILCSYCSKDITNKLSAPFVGILKEKLSTKNDS